MPSRSAVNAAGDAARVGRPPVGGPAPGRSPQRRPAGKAGRRTRAELLEHRFLLLLAIGRRGLLLGLALAVLVAFIAGTVEQRWKESQLREQVAAQEAMLQVAERRNADLRAQLADADPVVYRAWVEAAGRRQLNVGYPGETIYLVNWTGSAPGAAPAPGISPPPIPPPARPEANWRKWWRMVRGG